MSWLSKFVGEWSDAFFITRNASDRWYSHCQNRPGVYRLVAMRPAGHEGLRPMARVCGIDRTGTVYIGKAKGLGTRLAALVMTHDPSYATKKHKPFPKRLAECIPVEDLALCFSYTETEAAASAAERGLLAFYKGAFGEPPPLNGQG